MIPLILLSLLCLSSQGGGSRHHDVSHCGPQNLTLTSSEQTIHATWEDDPSCSAVNDELVYELLVLVGNEQVHHELVTVPPAQIGSAHLWTWTSHVAFECDAHLVRLSVRFKNSSSSWTREGTVPAKRTESQDVEVYPQDRVLAVGSRATFCCVVPEGGRFNKTFMMDYESSALNVRQISNQTHLLTVVLDKASSKSCTNVICQAAVQHGRGQNGACVKIGYPPADRDLRCETRDLESVECHWTVGRETHLLTPTQYQLGDSACAPDLPGRCSQSANVSAGQRSWRLTARNKLGTAELWDTADLMNRVHMFAPESVTASSVTDRDATLQWTWKVQRYRRLNVACQVKVSGLGAQELTHISGVGLDSAVVRSLVPNWRYNATVRCRTTPHSYIWSDWSSALSFRTEGAVPDALDVWMKAKDGEILIIWKVLQANQSHGLVLDYTVTWSRSGGTEQHNATTVTHNSVTLALDTTRQYVVKVTARNVIGSSSPSTVITPLVSGRPDDATRTNTSHIVGKDGVFCLSWSPSPAASCGYIVDWRPTSGPRVLDWLKVHHTNVTIVSDALRSGQRYQLSISACTRAAPLLLDRRRGYVREERIPDKLFKNCKVKAKGSEVEVSWDPVALEEQTAFIRGYVLSWVDHNHHTDHVTTDDPSATSLTASDLRPGSYSFTVKARTALGECGSTPLSYTVNSPTDSLVQSAVVSLVAVFTVLLLVSVVCCRHWACIKQKVYPPIPRPLLSDTWLKAAGAHRGQLQVDQCPSEVHVVDAPQLLYKPGAEVKGLVFPQTLHGYYSQPGPLPSPSRPPPSPFRSVFPNPSYDLKMSSDYRAQSLGLTPADQEPGSHMTCAFTYVLLPQPTDG